MPLARASSFPLPPRGGAYGGSTREWLSARLLALDQGPCSQPALGRYATPAHVGADMSEPQPRYPPVSPRQCQFHRASVRAEHYDTAAERERSQHVGREYRDPTDRALAGARLVAVPPRMIFSMEASQIAAAWFSPHVSRARASERCTGRCVMPILPLSVINVIEGSLCPSSAEAQ